MEFCPLLAVIQGSGGDLRSYRCNTYLGPASTSEDVSALSSSLVQHTMEGGNCSILCHGITGREAVDAHEAMYLWSYN